MMWDRRAELGEFLRSRRARLRPEELGLTAYGQRRRVPGLRREELAQLAGVSVDHYIRLEQGRTLHFSAEVLDAVARALRLDPAERAHLHRLARPAPPVPPGVPATADRPPLRAGIHRMLASIHDVPAYLVDRDTTVLAWNRPAAALITDFGALPPEQRNMARLTFLDEGIRHLYADWPTRARDIVAFLRLDAGHELADASVAALVAELSAASDEFRRLWSEHRVKDKRHGRYLYRHPLVGELELAYEVLRLPDHPGLALVVHTAEEGSASETALRLLTTWAGQETPAP
ncbi:helix-turn-helix domain-containing protein [Nonomuraea rhodomycinica]|uniref:Helix-turn-helix domain-containing protein n=1 Tax=Nonomuraea rhodomycinica TaxID=1712872 RepID=A0A7Y6IX71_9ACTN|nr:helix-turn-helix transcriptional regulator [Nonomuraea rhodomycinica]NUW46046.1 helix-turn-helix domain-containing protein [Nonomuraea rhodomycinica]